MGYPVGCGSFRNGLGLILLLGLILVLLPVQVWAKAPQRMTIPFVPSRGLGYVPDEIVVLFDSETSQKRDPALIAKGATGEALLDQVNTKFKALSVRRQFPGSGLKRVKGRLPDLGGWHKIKFQDRVSLDQAVKAYKALPQVLDAQPIGIHSLSAVPNDGRYSRQWHLNQANDRDMDGPETWENLRTGLDRGLVDLSGVVVAVLDSGVRYFHKDLGGSGASHANPQGAAGNMWINPAEKNGTSGVDDDGNGYVDDWIGWDFVGQPRDCWSGEDCSVPDNDPRDFNGHGTHCAGNIAAMTNNGYSVSSPGGGWGTGSLLAEGNGARVMALRMGWSASDQGTETGMVRMDYAAQALYYAADNGAKIASCSWGSSNTGGLGAAIDYFLAQGGMIFKSAGNDNREFSYSHEDYMCSRPDVVCVGATDQSDCKASFSNYGSEVDICAPGVSIESLYHYHPSPESDYSAAMNGTSMATPLAAGAAALVWGQNPSWTASQVREKLLASADPLDGLSCNSAYSGLLGAGRINLFQATHADMDSDGVHDWSDYCPQDPGKDSPGACGCGVSDTDGDSDNTPDCHDQCPGDPEKIEPGACGCGVPDMDTDKDSSPDCQDGCPQDPGKTAAGICGCGTPDTDSDSDGSPDCHDQCPGDPEKIEPGSCGCGLSDLDTDQDLSPDCLDGCPQDPGKVDPGTCGCGVSETDEDQDNVPDCKDNCPGTWNPDQADSNGNGRGDSCEPAQAVSGPTNLLILVFLGLALAGACSLRSKFRG